MYLDLCLINRFLLLINYIWTCVNKLSIPIIFTFNQIMYPIVQYLSPVCLAHLKIWYLTNKLNHHFSKQAFNSVAFILVSNFYFGITFNFARCLC